MPSPFTWDTTAPAGTDGLNIGDDQIRDDKATLLEVLGTLVPNGTPTTGWRVTQVNNDIYLTSNASYDGAAWQRDDVAVVAYSLVFDVANDKIVFARAAAAANPITWVTLVTISSAGVLTLLSQLTTGASADLILDGQSVNIKHLAAAGGVFLKDSDGAVIASFIRTASEVNYLQHTGAAAGAEPVIAAVGSDTDVGIKLTPKGAGLVEITANPLRLATDPTNDLDAATKQYVDDNAATKKRVAVLVVPGTPAAATGLSIGLLMPVAGTITAIKSTCRTAGGGSGTYDINKGGTTIYTTQANRPVRESADGTGSKTHTAPDVTSFSAGDLFNVDLDSVGGAGNSTDVVFFIEFNEA